MASLPVLQMLALALASMPASSHLPLRVFSLAPMLALAQSQPPAKDVVFNVRLAVDPLGFDWGKTSTDWLIASNIMEGLVQYNADLSVRPALARHWNVSADQKTYTFTLIENARWSDGAPILADHFANAWERVLNPDTGSPYAPMLFDVVGAREFHGDRSRKRDFSKVGITVLGPHSLQVRLKHPAPYFLSLLTYRALFPIRLDLIEKSTNYWANPTKVVVTGPFYVSSYKAQKQVILKRNPYYYGKAAQLDVIQMPIIKDNREAIRRFDAGDLDFVTKIDFRDLEGLSRKNMAVIAPSFLLHFLAFNTKQYPLSLPLVRQAFSMAIDRVKLNALFGESKIPSISLLPAPLVAGIEVAALPFNPLEARKRMRDAGIETTAGITIDVLGDTNDDNSKLTEFVRGEFKKNLFLDVNVNLSDYKNYRTALEMGAGAVYSRMWSPDYPSVEAFLKIFTSESGTHKTGWNSAAYDRFVSQAEEAADPGQRRALHQKALETLLREECPVVPLFYAKHVYLLNPRFSQLAMRPIGSPYFKDVRDSRSP